MDGGGALQRADQQRTLRRRVVLDHPGRLADQAAYLLGIRQQAPPGRRRGHPAAMALEQRRVQLLLQHADARGDVGLHGVELGGGAAHAAQARYGFENAQIGAIHDIGPAISNGDGSYHI